MSVITCLIHSPAEGGLLGSPVTEGYRLLGKLIFGATSRRATVMVLICMRTIIVPLGWPKDMIGPVNVWRNRIICTRMIIVPLGWRSMCGATLCGAIIFICTRTIIAPLGWLKDTVGLVNVWRNHFHLHADDHRSIRTTKRHGGVNMWCNHYGHSHENARGWLCMWNLHWIDPRLILGPLKRLKGNRTHPHH